MLLLLLLLASTRGDTLLPRLWWVELELKERKRAKMVAIIAGSVDS